MPEITLDDLLKGPQFARTYGEKREVLLPMLHRQALRCAAHHVGLAKYQREMAFPSTPNDYDQLPYLPVSMFKECDLATVPGDQVVRTLLSSATTGSRPSRVPLDKVTGKNQARGLAAILMDVLGPRRRPFLILDVPEINLPGEQLTARGAAARGIMPFASEMAYALKQEGEGFALDLETIDQFFADHAGQDILLFGFTYLVWTEVVRGLRQAGRRFEHPQLILLHSGGWKKLTEDQVTKDVFADGVAEVFGCPSTAVRDFYGMVEQVGVVFVDCEAGHKHSPAFAEVAIRDFDTLEQVPAGGQGMIQVMSLLPESYPGYALITEDVGQVMGFDDCSCGRPGLHFKFRSRVHQVEVRGCGDTVAASRPLPAETVPPVGLGPIDDALTCLKEEEISLLETPEQTMAKVRADLMDAETLPHGAVRALLDAVSLSLLDEGLADIEGLAFLSAWLKGPNLARVVETNFGERTTALDSPVPDGNQALLAAPRGLAAHWVAGNVPTLAVFSWALATLAGNASVVRVSQAATDQTRRLFAAIGRAEASWEGVHFTGHDLLVRTRVVHFDSAHQVWNRALSEVADVRLIWGGREAVNAARRLPVAEHCEDLVFGPKFSLALVDRAALADPDRAEHLAKAMAREVAVFDQAACSSPQVLFLEGSLLDHTEWLQRVHFHLGVLQDKRPRRRVNETAAAGAVRQRASHGLTPDHRVWASQGTEHTILAAEGAELPEAVQARTLFVRCVTDLQQAVPLMTPKIQTVGLAVDDADLRDALSLAAARAGVARCVPLGTMNFFETPWDGMLPLSRLVRWVRVPGRKAQA